MKNKPLKIILISACLSSFSYSIPVISVPQVIENVFTELRNNYETLVTWKREAEQWKNDYEAITKFKLDSNLLNEFQKINDILGKYGLSMSDIDLINPSSEIAQMAKSMFNTYSLFDDCSFDFMGDEDKRICQDTIVREVQEIQAINGFSEQITKALEKINELNSQLSGGEKGSRKTSEAGSDGGFDMETFSQNQQDAVTKAKEEEDTSITSAFADLFTDESDGSVSFSDFSSDEQSSFDDMMGNFSDSENSTTDSDENSIKMSQDVTAGLKSVSITMKALKIQYKLIKIKNKSKEKLDKRRLEQLHMKKFEYTKNYLKSKSEI
ncbi:MAG: hypothetical protein L3J43_04865 [Sulfurovum sp.]|nr:hypothetical protein [Sulfurovum sp.]